MKYLLFFFLLFIGTRITAQKIDSIFVNLYTDSLKKGTYNYINIDGLLSNGNYTPLDSSQINFVASKGHFSGNSLWIDKDFTGDKVTITVVLRSNPALNKKFEVYIKKKPDNERLKTADEIMKEIRNVPKTKKRQS